MNINKNLQKIDLDGLDFNKTIRSYSKKYKIPHATLVRFFKKMGVFHKFKYVGKGKGWSKDLSSKNDSVVRKMNNKIQNLYNTGQLRRPMLGKKHTKELKRNFLN